MGVIRDVALIVLSISFVTFVALFGRLPTFRKTPIGFLHRIIWIHTPNVFKALDVRITGGRLSRWLERTGYYLMNEKHPLVQIFFLALLSISQAMFIPPAWSRLTFTQKMLVLAVITPPYILIYAAATSDSAIITSANHEMNMHLYPYDYAIFHPGHTCRTCHLLKPARSKHCGICKSCVARQDHHCIWLNNCVGRGNYGYFLNLLISLTVMLMYGVYLGYGMLDRSIQIQYERWSHPGGAKSHWSTGESWSTYFQLWSMAITDDVRVGGITLLSLLTAPITFGLLAYHIYLIWAGMTTNESNKWADWRDDIADGVVFKEKRTKLLAAGLMHADTTPKVDWPTSTDQVLVRTEDGEPPGSKNGVGAEAQARLKNGISWKKVKRLEEVDNLYDLGFRDNIIHSFRG